MVSDPFRSLFLFAAATAKSLQSCPTLCDPIDGSPPGSPIPGILQARTQVGCCFLLQCMEVKSESEVAQSCPTLSDPMDCSLPGSPLPSPPFLFTVPLTQLLLVCLCAQSFPTLCNPMDCSRPDSSVHGILQARILGWVAISFSKGSSQSGDQT